MFPPRTTIPALLALTAVAPLRAQRLTDRVAGAREGTVTFTYASRPEVCGDGRSIIVRQLGTESGVTIYSPDGMTSLDSWNGPGPTCAHGPVRVRLSLRNGQVVALRPSVGWTGGAGGAKDLGTAGGQQAADYLLAVARTASEEVCYSAMFAAAIADSARVSATLLVIARDRSLRPANREQALKWVARTAPREGNDAAGAGVRAIAADETDNPDVRERAIRVLTHPEDDAFLRGLYGRLSLRALKERVIRVVAESQTPANLEWLERIARDDREPVDLRDRAIRVLGEELHEADRLRTLYPRLGHADLKDRVIRVVGEDGSEDALLWIETLAENRAEPHEARDRALRVLGEHGGVAYLRQIYGRLDDAELQDRVLREAGEAGGAENVQFLRAVVLDHGANMDVRDRALRELAGAGLGTAQLVALYDSVAGQDLRLRLVRLLAERGDAAARDKLAVIARQDPDPELRRKALRQLAEIGDPRGRRS
jgi:hypothetical protein